MKSIVRIAVILILECLLTSSLGQKTAINSPVEVINAISSNDPQRTQNVATRLGPDESGQTGTIGRKHSRIDLPPAQFSWGGLYPRDTATRETKSLDGVWNFRLSPKDDPEKGFRESWFSAPLSTTGEVIAMAVPSSYNDVTQDIDLRDHVGWAWYDTTFITPKRWLDDNQRIMLRFGSAHYTTIVYVNGVAVTSHEGGHLPFLADISASLKASGKNLLTVAVDNVLTNETIPQGELRYETDVSRYPPGYFYQYYDFDFFNYAGIHRSVILYSTPQSYIDDVVVTTNAAGVIDYSVDIVEDSGVTGLTCAVEVLDANDTVVVQGSGCSGTVTVPEPQLWWPYLMNPNPGYLYTLQVSLMADGTTVVDEYPVKVGLRELAWDSTGLTMNGEPLYVRGCGKHEDSDIRGKGYDPALVVKDFSLLKWLGANAFRTSHYPYAEEIMDRADAEGIMVIDECPGVNLRTFDAALEARHKAVMTELIRRDQNRPSVIAWSVANEPRSSQAAAADYFANVAASTRAADPTRPVTAAINEGVDSDNAAQSLDIIWVNRYDSWYSDSGHLELIQRQMVTDITAWYAKYQRPVGISEYGADSITGLHMDPPFMWSEEYQMQLFLNNFAAFDTLRSTIPFMGEMFWNFADFMTQQGTGRAGGNKKGVLTRSRQPKPTAFLVRERYNSLASGDRSADTCPSLAAVYGGRH